MKNFVIAFVFGFATHFVISKYLFLGPESVAVSNKGQNINSLETKSLSENKNNLLAETPVSAFVNSDSKMGTQSEVDGFSNCPTTSVTKDSEESITDSKMAQIKNQKIFKQFEVLIADRKIQNMDSKDLSMMSDKVLSDPGLTLARSNQVIRYKDLKPLNGVYEGHLNSTDSEGEFKSIEALIEIEFTSDANKNATGTYLLELKDQGASSGRGTPNGFKRNPATSDFFIQFGSDQYLQVTELNDYLKANYYKNNELAGFAKLKRIR